MHRIIGMSFVWGGCTLFGVREGQLLRRRVRLLEDMVRALEVLERELNLNQTALPELLERQSRGTGGSGALFFACRSGMEQGKGFAQAWSDALEESELEREERELLCGLSHVLGRYDAQGQVQALSHLRSEVERRCVYRREEARAMGRVYGVLGVAAGGFLSLMLI